MTTTPALDALATIRDGATTTITGEITAVEPRATGQNTPWAVITISGQDGTATVYVPPRYYLQHRHLLHTGAAVTANGRVSQWREPVLMASSIQTADGGR